MGQGTAADNGKADVRRQFGAMIQRTVEDDNPEKGAAFLIDFDDGKVTAIPPKALSGGFADAIRWMPTAGIDAMCKGANEGLIGIDIIAMPAGTAIATGFPEFPEETVLREFQLLDSIGRAGTPVSINAEAGIGPDATYLFKTREGAKGVLQIAGWDPKSQAVKINYRLLITSSAAYPKPTLTEQAPSKRYKFNEIDEREVKPTSEPHLLDFDTGKTHAIPSDAAEIKNWERFIRSRSVDFHIKPIDTREVRFYNAVLVGVPNDRWSDPEKHAADLNWLSPAYPSRTTLFRAGSILPATFLFKTEEGTLGICQIVAWNDKAKSVQFRFRTATVSGPKP
jgi:hypothetical protein